ERLDALILNVTRSMTALKGEAATMSDREKFEGFKQSLMDENERKYGAEVRERYGNRAVEESNAKVKGLTREQYDEGERLRLEFEQALKAAFDTGDPAGAPAREACDLHRRWLCLYYPEYSREYHMGLGEMYAADERFKAHYDRIAPGAAEFLRDAICVYCNGAAL
ncbi:MAG: TipAS antibiotic-recognition domain-containing protein, partial [Peptococcaceae bacterium]|nr:TipAS antibiotic-recognition domain-containing protein [Peptococcaceae bacterium]